MSVEMDLFEEAAKFRAARRIWAKLAKERLGAKDPRSYKLKISAKTSGSSLTAQQPINNVVRTTVETLAAILGGVQVIEPCGYDEAYTIPTEESATVALNLQHILHHEGRLVNTVDPLGGSYYVEHLTNEVEEEALAILQRILDRGGIYAAVQQGWIKEEVRREAIKRQKEIEDREKVLVGVNDYVVPKEEEIPLKIYRDKRLGEFSRFQEEQLTRLKKERDLQIWRESLERLREKAERGEKENLMLPIKKALQAQATLGEILGVIRETYGLSHDPLNMIDSPLASLV
jgi:methylmalonyl-CoA mutase N-terminal domain/subunit